MGRKSKSLVAWLLFFFCSLPAPAQTYTVTEAQLQKLEAICQSYKATNQIQLQQLDELKQTAQRLRTESEQLKQDSKTLQQQLENERTSTRNLNSSLLKSETRSAQIEAERDELLLKSKDQENRMKLLQRRYRSLLVSFILTTLALIAGGIACIWWKLKR